MARRVKDIRKAAARYSQSALETLAEIMERGASEQARIAAADKLLDRAHGRPRAEAEGAGGPTLAELIREAALGTPPEETPDE